MSTERINKADRVGCTPAHTTDVAAIDQWTLAGPQTTEADVDQVVHADDILGLSRLVTRVSTRRSRCRLCCMRAILAGQMVSGRVDRRRPGDERLWLIEPQRGRFTRFSHVVIRGQRLLFLVGGDLGGGGGGVFQLFSALSCNHTSPRSRHPDQQNTGSSSSNLFAIWTQKDIT